MTWTGPRRQPRAPSAGPQVPPAAPEIPPQAPQDGPPPPMMDPHSLRCPPTSCVVRNSSHVLLDSCGAQPNVRCDCCAKFSKICDPVFCLLHAGVLAADMCRLRTQFTRNWMRYYSRGASHYSSLYHTRPPGPENPGEGHQGLCNGRWGAYTSCTQEGLHHRPENPHAGPVEAPLPADDGPGGPQDFVAGVRQDTSARRLEDDTTRSRENFRRSWGSEFLFTIFTH